MIRRIERMKTDKKSSTMASAKTSPAVSPVGSDLDGAIVHLEETFYILSKKNAVFRVRLTDLGLCLRKESDGRSKEQMIPLRDIIGARCMRSKRRAPGAGSCVCSSLSGSGAPALRVVDEASGDRDENDASAYLYVYAYALKAARRGSKRERTTVTLRFRSFDKYDDNNREAHKWRATIKCLVGGVPPPPAPPPPHSDKKLLVLLNPKAGAGKARENFQQKVVPMLAEAEVPYDLHVTKFANFAREFVRTRNVYGWRAIVVVGGDGILFEVLNGLFERLDWQQALAEVPLAVLPSGSGNGLARTICHSYNEPYVPGQMTGLTMALAREKSAPMDVVRVETKTQILYSFLSIGWGFLSDVDIESERLRAIGGQRFTVWAFARLIGLRTYRGVVSYVPIKNVDVGAAVKQPVTLSHSVSHEGTLDSPDSEAFADCEENSEIFTNALNGGVQRRQRVDSWHSVNSRRSAFFSTRGSEYYSTAGSEADVRSPVATRTYGPASHLPALTAPLPSHWVHEEGEFVMVHVASQSYLGEDFFFAPRSKLCDGVLWMMIVKAGISRAQLMSYLIAFSTGAHADLTCEYMKLIPVSAFRIVPAPGPGYLTVDGELVDYGPVQAEVFPNIASIIVPHN